MYGPNDPDPYRSQRDPNPGLSWDPAWQPTRDDDYAALIQQQGGQVGNFTPQPPAPDAYRGDAIAAPGQWSGYPPSPPPTYGVPPAYPQGTPPTYGVPQGYSQNWPPTQGMPLGYLQNLPQPQYRRQSGLAPFVLVLGGLAVLIALGVGIWMASITHIWWLALLLPLSVVSSVFRNMGRGGVVSSARLISTLISLAVMAGVLFTIFFKLNGIF